MLRGEGGSGCCRSAWRSRRLQPIALTLWPPSSGSCCKADRAAHRRVLILFVAQQLDFGWAQWTLPASGTGTALHNPAELGGYPMLAWPVAKINHAGWARWEVHQSPRPELQIFNYFIEGVTEKIRATNELPIPPSRLALKAALRASLEIGPWNRSCCAASTVSSRFRTDDHCDGPGCLDSFRGGIS